MTDIINESGASAGSIYAHFEGKLELARYVAERILANRSAQLNRALGEADAGAMAPREVLERVLGGGTLDREWARLLMQIWAEASHDEKLAEMVAENIAKLRQMLADAVLPWALANQSADPTASAHKAADRAADAVLALAHGYATRIALDPSVDEQALPADISTLLDPSANPST